jgi:transposase-like protein
MENTLIKEQLLEFIRKNNIQEDKIIALYSKGITTRDIHEQIKDIYDIRILAEMVSKITEKIIPEIREKRDGLI